MNQEFQSLVIKLRHSTNKEKKLIEQFKKTNLTKEEMLK